MKSLEERHAERDRRRKEGPGPVVIQKDEPVEQPAGDDDETRPAMINKRPGSSRADPTVSVQVEGDDSIDNGFRILGDADRATTPVGTQRAVTNPDAAAGNGGGAKPAAKTWQPKG